MFSTQDAGLRSVALFSTRKKMALLLAGLIVLAAALDIAIPFITRRLIDTLIVSFQSPGVSARRVLIGSAIAILLATLLTRAVRSLYSYCLFKTTTELEDETRFRAFGNYLQLHALYHHKANSGQIIGRIDAGCTAVFTVLF